MKKVFLVLFAAALFTMTAWAQGTSSPAPAGAAAQADNGTTSVKKHHHRKHRKHRKHHKSNSQ